jgi:hypothetical protein
LDTCTSLVQSCQSNGCTASVDLGYCNPFTSQCDNDVSCSSSNSCDNLTNQKECENSRGCNWLGATDPPSSGVTFTAYAIGWFGETRGTICPPTEPAPIARCGGEGTILIMDRFSDGIDKSNHDCATNVTDTAALVCAPQNVGFIYVRCMGEAAEDRELSFTMPADTAFCDGFAADDQQFSAIQDLVLYTWCGDAWFSGGDICSENSALVDGSWYCFSGDNCGDSPCTANLPAVTVTSTRQLEAQCTYVESGAPTMPTTMDTMMLTMTATISTSTTMPTMMPTSTSTTMRATTPSITTSGLTTTPSMIEEENATSDGLNAGAVAGYVVTYVVSITLLLY